MSTPEPIRSLLHRLLARSPRNRPENAELVTRELDRSLASLGVRSSARELSLWLTDLGVVRLESGVRSTLNASASEPHESQVCGAREEQATTVDADALKPVDLALPAPLADEPRGRAGAAPTLRYRLRRPGGEVVGPMSLSSVLALLATARAGLDSELAREEGPFWRLSRAFELTRLACRPLYRFFEPIALLATERHPVERVGLAAHLLRLALHGRTGLLVWRHGAEQRRLYFEGGELGASASTEPSELLGKQLVRDGIVAEEDFERVLESGYRSGCQVGESLVRAGLLSSDALTRAIAAQRLRRLTALCRASSGELFFLEGATSGEQVLAAASSPVQPLLEALRAAYSTAELLTLLSGLERAALSPAPSCAAIRSELCSSVDEAYAFDLCARGVRIGLILREARVRGEAPLRAAAFSVFMGLSASAFLARVD